MKAFKKALLKSVALILLFLCVTGTWFFVEFILPVRIVCNPYLKHSAFQGDQASREKIRRACHKILSYRIGNYHDAFIVIDEVGNKESIPYLIRALKSLHQWPLKNMDLGATVESCSVNLKYFTGMDFGDDYEKWENWWKETGRHLPFDEEKGQLILPEKEE